MAAKAKRKDEVIEQTVADDENRMPVQKTDQETDEITYLPEEGDPVRVKWAGLEFKAHVPTKVSRKHVVLTLQRIQSELPDGSIVSRAVEKRTPLAELAKGNCRFMVNGVPPAERETGRVATPDNSDEYRGYCMRWVAASTAPSAMDARWQAEEMLREKCGCNDHDIAYLRPFFEARHEALGGGTPSGHGRMREVLMGLTPNEIAMEARRAR